MADKAPIASTGAVEELVVGEIDKNAKVKTIVRLTKFKEKDYVDIRNFVGFTDNAGQFKYYPTTKGVALRVEHLSDLIGLLEQAELKLKGK